MNRYEDNTTNPAKGISIAIILSLWFWAGFFIGMYFDEIWIWVKQ